MGAFAYLQPAPAKAAVEVFGECGVNPLPPMTTWQIYQSGTVPSANSIDQVKGDATARDLEVCIGNLHAGNTEVMFANLQSTVTGIYQLGYWKDAGTSAIKFVYAEFTTTAIPITSVSPAIGTTYRGKIFNNAGNIRYEIWNVGTNTLIWSRNSGYAWSSSLKTAWFGYETGDSQSNHGHCGGCARINMTNMLYHVTNDSLWTQICNSTIHRNSPDIPSNHHGHIITTCVFDGETH